MAYDNHIPVHKGVLGGEACIWTEYIDENNLGNGANIKIEMYLNFRYLMRLINLYISLAINILPIKLDQRLWPRACAVGERLWSNPSTPSTKAGERLNQHRKRLQSLGIKPEPLQPEYCSLNEGQCL